VLGHPAWRLLVYLDAVSTFWVEGQSKSTKKNTNRKWPTARNLNKLPSEYERNTSITRCSIAHMMKTDCHQHLDERNILCCKACLGPSQSQHKEFARKNIHLQINMQIIHSHTLHVYVYHLVLKPSQQKCR
jgi:hypothetical protein